MFFDGGRIVLRQLDEKEAADLGDVVELLRAGLQQLQHRE